MSRVTPLLCPLLIGRDDLLDLADRRLGDAIEGRGQMLLLAGEAGIGKSRFLESVIRKATDRGVRIAMGNIAPQDLTVPGAIFLDLARTLQKTEGLEPLGTELRGLLEFDDDIETRTRRKIVNDVTDRICTMIEGPTLLALEDLQWADELSLEITSELARDIRGRPILLVGAYRTDEGSTGRIREWRARLMTQRLAEEARLAPLNREQTALMTTLILGTGLPAPRKVIDAVYERTDGIPLHIEELLGAIGDDARIDGNAIRQTSVPVTIEDAVLARFERLSPEAQAVAQAGAVIGRCFVPEVLAGIMDLPLASLDAPLMELVDRAFLEPSSADGLFDYRHQLLRDTLYRRVPVAARRRLHARAGEFGAALEGASEIHASAHFERAGLRTEAFQAALSGARSAARLSAHAEAFELYRRAVDNMPADLDPAEQGRLYDATCWEAAAIEMMDASVAAARSAREQYLRADLPLKAASMLTASAMMARREARPLAERIDLIERCLAELESIAESPEREHVRAVAFAELAQLETDRMDLRRARDAYERSVQAARKSDDPGLVMDAEIHAAVIAVLAGAGDHGLARIGAVARAARDAGREDPAVTAYRDGVTTAVRVMRYDIARNLLQAGLLYADAIKQSHCRHVMGSAQAQVDWAEGRWDAAMAAGEQELVDGGCTRGAIGAEVAIGQVAMGRGDLDHARSVLSRALAAGEPSDVIDLVLPARAGLAETEFLAGQPEAAIAHCEAALEVALRVGERALLVPFAVIGIRAYLAVDRPEAAARWAAAVEAHLAPWAPASPFAAAINHMTGAIKLSAGATGIARDSFEAAITGWDATGRVWEASWARLDLAACHLRSNRFAEAAAVLSEVRATASRLGSEPLLARVDELARVTHRGRGTLDEPWRPLTSREFEVARLISEGMTNAEIGDALSISPKTASAHVEHILAKLGVARRAEIAAWVANISRSAVSSSR